MLRLSRLIIIFLFSLLSFAVTHPRKPPPFPNRFSCFIETVTDREPDFLTVFVDTPLNRSRYDYLNEQMIYIYRYDLGYEYIFNRTSEVCEEIPLRGSIEAIFPTFVNGTWKGTEWIRGVECNCFRVKLQNDTIDADYYATVAGDIPMRLVWSEGTHQNSQDYVDFVLGPPPPEVFTFPPPIMKTCHPSVPKSNPTVLEKLFK
jgi:hypothetical protein